LNLAAHSTWQLRWAVFMVATLFALTFASIPHTASASSSSSATGVIIPLYTYPGSTWTAVIQAKAANPGVSIVAVINPDNGPGASQDPNYVSGIQGLRSAGVIVLGYVHTSYAARPAASVIADINSYKGWYNISGIFLDEMSNVAGNEGYYSSLNTYIESLGYTMTVGNPGADTIPGYIGTVNVIVVYENLGLPSPSALAGWHASYAKSNFASISYGMGSINQTDIARISNSVGYVYLTSGIQPNPYDSLPPYFGSLVAALGSHAGSDTQSQTTTTSSVTASGHSGATPTSAATVSGVRQLQNYASRGFIIGMRAETIVFL
jgi:spherulation-specific family 4 protein